MSFIDKIKIWLKELGDKVRIFFFYLGIHLSTPVTLVSFIYIISLILWGIFEYVVGESIFKFPRIIFIVAISYLLFLVYIMYLMFPPAKNVKIIVDAYGGNPRIISFIGEKIKKWLKNIIDFIEQQPTYDEIMEPVNNLNINGLEELKRKIPKSLPKPSKIKELADEIEKEGNYLNDFVEGVSRVLQIPQESIEELINTKIGVNQKIGKEIITSYDQIKNGIEGLISAINSGDNYIINSYRRRIKVRTDYLRIKKESLNAQIKWIKELDKRKEAIPELLEIIEEPSTGKAVAKLSRLLFEKVRTVEDIIWLIRFANSRKGTRMSDLLGLNIVKETKMETVYWYERKISQDVDLQEVKRFLESFVRKRGDALEKMWKEFREWNIKTRRIDFAQPIAIGLTSGYSAALKKILQGICGDVGDIRLLRIILIKKGEVSGGEEILKAELMAGYPGLKCDIVPIEVIGQKEIQRRIRIGNIFVGIESINKKGDIVHPRGGSEIISTIKELNKDIKVYAVGESYKVQEFTELDIDYTKLSLFLYENIDYVVTDHGVHERKGDKWEIEGKLKDDLDCCAKYWKM
jgi:hypothetical protein